MSYMGLVPVDSNQTVREEQGTSPEPTGTGSVLLTPARAPHSSILNTKVISEPQPASGGSPMESASPQSGAVRKLTPRSEVGDPGARPVTSAVRPLPTTPTVKPHVVAPSSFNDAQEVGDMLRKQKPVIVNLQAVEKDLARRLIDFSSGVCYGVGGQMERVANQVYLLTPADVEVSQDERRRLRERGLADR